MPTLNSIGDVAAIVPGAIGFYPRESVVLMAFSAASGSLRLGPILRCDLADAHTLYLPEVEVDGSPLDAALVFIVSENDEFIDWAAYQVQSHLGDSLLGIWRTAQLLEGELIDPICLSDGAPEGWQGGNVSPIHAAPTTAELLQRGSGIALDREELAARFDHVDADPQFMSAFRAARDSIFGMTGAEFVPSSVAALEKAINHWAYTPEDLAWLEVAFRAKTDSRDMALALICSNPERGREFGLQLASLTDSEEARAVALCAYAVAAVDTEPSASSMALQIAQELRPTMKLVELMQGLLMIGQLPKGAELICAAGDSLRHEYAI